MLRVHVPPAQFAVPSSDAPHLSLKFVSYPRQASHSGNCCRPPVATQSEIEKERLALCCYCWNASLRRRPLPILSFGSQNIGLATASFLMFSCGSARLASGGGGRRHRQILFANTAGHFSLCSRWTRTQMANDKETNTRAETRRLRCSQNQLVVQPL